MGVIKIVQFIVAVLPLIQQIVLTLEQSFPAQGAGTSKLNAAVGMVSCVLTTAGATAQELEQLADPITHAINTVVQGLNQAGILKGGNTVVMSAGAPVSVTPPK